MEQLDLHIESLIFAAAQGISFDEIKATLEAAFQVAIVDQMIQDAITRIISKYDDPIFPFEVIEMSGGFRFLTKGSYHNTISQFLKQSAHQKLSKSAMETLSIIAYKQPVTKTDIESIRGVNSDYTVQKLLEKDLVEIVGRSDGPGRPLVYKTSQNFMDYFGLRSMDDLPKLSDVIAEM
ncbi:MAG: SMC-Scp complex subunit ScpB [Saprospiraceae bacterium]